MNEYFSRYSFRVCIPTTLNTTIAQHAMSLIHDNLLPFLIFFAAFVHLENNFYKIIILHSSIQFLIQHFIWFIPFNSTESI